MFSNIKSVIITIVCIRCHLIQITLLHVTIFISGINGISSRSTMINLGIDFGIFTLLEFQKFRNVRDPIRLFVWTIKITFIFRFTTAIINSNFLRLFNLFSIWERVIILILVAFKTLIKLHFRLENRLFD